MKITDDGRVVTLEQLAASICHSYDDDENGCDKCPASDYCCKGHTGMVDWLREVISNEHD